MSDPKLLAVLRDVLGSVAPDLDVASVAPTDDLRNDLELDSMDFLNFVIGVSERLGVQIPEADYGRVGTLARLADYVAARQPAAKP